jgi:hypothetical protein
MIKESDFENLRFSKNVVTKEESGNNSDYYYYSLQLTDGIILTSVENDLVIHDGWYVTDFDNEIKIDNIDDLCIFITLISSFKFNFKECT